MEGLKASVDGDVDINKDDWVSKLNEQLGDLAETQDVTAEDVTIKVKSGDCLWEIGNALGIDWQTIAEQNGIEDPYIIHPDQELTISMDTLTAEIDGDKAQAAIEQAMSALDAEGAEMSVTAEGVKIDLADVEVNSDTAAAQIEAALGMESGTLAANDIEVQTGASVTIPSELVQVDTSGLQSATEQAANETEPEPVEQETSANVNITNTTTDTSGVQAQAEEDVQGAVDNIPADGHADITLDHPGSEAEAERIYTEVSSEVESQFSATIPATADVAVTLNWKITNPSANITATGSGSTVSATITGHASGGEVGRNGAELSWVGEEGLEYIIPTVPGRRQRGIELWKSAGRTLGVLDSDNQISAHANGGVVGGDIPNTVPYSGSGDPNTVPYSDTDSDSSGSENSEKGNVPTNVTSEKSGIVVQVNVSPQFNISDTNDNEVIRLIKEHIKELADDLGSEIATMLSEAYENTPVTS